MRKSMGAGVGIADPPRSVSTSDAAVTLQGVSKTFPGVRALSDVSFDCVPGEVHALVGENGSGKSTLIKVASGVLVPEEGSVLIGGEPLTGGNKVQQARKLGLMVAYQDTSLVEELTVAENVALSFNAIGEARPSDLGALLARYQLPFKPSDSVAALGPGARQLLEVARAMSHQPRVLMLDEPTAALDMRFAAHLEELIKQCRDEGTAIVYVSHRLAEVRRLADRLTVIRDGVIQATHTSRDYDVDEIVELMVGAPTDLEFPQRSGPTSDDVRLRARDLEGPGFGPVSIEVRAGEIVGIAGAEGNGQRALLRGIIGLGRSGGEVVVDGKPLRQHNPGAALDAGVSFQSGDRAAESVYLQMPVMDNATIQLGSDAGPLGLALPGRMRAAFEKVSQQLGIVAASPYQPISGLSGGNQQKVVLARAALRRPKVLIVDEPTQGVDARARLDIYRVLADAADEGIAVLVNSSDSSELEGLCDRIYVMSRGTVARELTGPTTEAEIVRSFVAAAEVEQDHPAQVSTGGLASRLWSRASSHVPVLVLLALIAGVSLYTGSRSDVFWSPLNLANTMLLALPLAAVALGQQFVLLSGGFDLSIGSTISLTVVLASLTLNDLSAQSLAITVPLLLLAAAAIGGFNALMIGALKVSPIVATIATLGIVQGIAILLRPEPGGSIAPQLGTSLSLGFGFVPGAFVVVVLVAVALEVWLYRSRGGLALRGVGFNPEASRRIGRRVGVLRSGGLMVCAFGAVVAGMFLASQVGVGSNAVGATYSLPCFAAVFLGGAALSGGRGSFVGALLGAVFLSLVGNVTPLLNIPDATRQLLYGAILLLAITAYALTQRSRSVPGHA